MVQAIRNDFTVLVYEENARISLEMVSHHSLSPQRKRNNRFFYFRAIENNSINVKLNWKHCMRVVVIRAI